MSDTYTPGPAFGSFADEQAQREYAAAHELTNRLNHVTQAAPYLADDPEVLAATAQLPYPTEQLGYFAASTSAQMSLANTAADLERMEPGRARAVYGLLTPQQQQGLQSMGYQVPTPNDGDPNSLLSFVGRGGAAVLGGVNTIITETPVVSQVFDVFNVLDNGVKTLYRNIRTDEMAWLATGAAIIGGVAAAPFTGGLSLAATGAAIAGGGLLAGNVAASLTNPGDYIEATRRNWNGETVFSQSAQQQARTLLRSSGLDVMARDLGWELDVDETVELFASTPEADSDAGMHASIFRILDRIADAGDPRREQLATALTDLVRIPEFREAVEILERSKVSFGRDVARLLGLEDGDQGYGFVSGALDATFTIVSDPTLMMGSAARWQRARRLGVPIEPDGAFDSINAIARRANEIPTVGAAYDEIARAVETGQPHILWRRVPQARGMYDDLHEWRELSRAQGRTGAFTRDDIFDWLHEGDNFQRMLAGHGVKQGVSRLMLPTYGWRVPLTQLTVPVGKIPEAMKATIDFADDANNRAHLRRVTRKLKQLEPETPPPATAVDRAVSGARELAVPDEEWRNIEKFIRVVDELPGAAQVMRKTGALLASFTEMMPATSSISMVGPQAAEDIQRMVALGRATGMTSFERKAWFDTIMQQRNIEHRINASLSYLDTMLTAGGARATQRGSELVDDFVRKVRHRYTLGLTDQYQLGERVVSRAIHPYQHTFDLPIPDMRELRQAIDKGLVMKYLYRVTDSEPVDVVVNRVWKPAVLLRVGFITRAAGEELLAHLVRAGPSSYINEFAARSIAEGRLHRSAKAAGEALEELGPDQLRAVERMRFAAHVRPLEQMFGNWNWTSPVNEYLARYTDFVRLTLERGLAPDLAARIPQSRQLMMLGRENSIRRSLLLGVDQDLIRYAESFGRRNAATILREVSSHNANIWSGTTIDDPNEFRIRWGEGDELSDLGFVVERGNWRTYRRDDPMFDHAAHGGVARLVNDEVSGPIYTEVTTRFLPSTLSEEQAFAVLDGFQAISDWRMQRVMRELLTYQDTRTVNWRSFLREVQGTDDAFGSFMRTAVPNLGPDQQDVRGVITALHQYRGRMPQEVSQRLNADINQIEALLKALDRVGPSERAWLAGFTDYWSRVPDRPNLLTNVEDYRTELVDKLVDRHYDVEVQPLVQNLTYANRLDDGRFVARPPIEGRTRVWVPEVTPETYGRLTAELRGVDPDEMVDRLMDLWAEAAPLLEGRHLAQADTAARRFFEHLVDRSPEDMIAHARRITGEGRVGGVVPLVDLGFDDPQLTQALSQFMNAAFSDMPGRSLSARLAESRGFSGQLDLDDRLRKLTAATVDSTARPVAHVSDTLPTTERTIHTWSLDQEYLTPRVVSQADRELVTLPDGSQAFGVHPDEAVRAGVNKQVDDWFLNVGAGTDQARIVKGDAYVDPNGTARYPAGTRLESRTEVYDVDGNPVSYADDTVFDLLDPTSMPDVHKNMTMTGPLLRDATDAQFGTTHYFADTRDIKNLDPATLARRAEIAPGPRRVPAPTGPGARPTQSREFRGHWSHMQDLPDAPMVAIGPTIRPRDEPSKWDKVLEFGFEKTISPAIDAIIRRPLSFHMYAEAMRENERALRWALPTTIFGDDVTGATGALHDELAELLDAVPVEVSRLVDSADDIRAMTRVLDPELAADLAILDDAAVAEAFYGRYVTGELLGDMLGGEARAAADAVRAARRGGAADLIQNASSGSRVGRELRAIRDTLTEPAARLYLSRSGRWITTKPRDLDGIVAIDVARDRVSSSMSALNGPTSTLRDELVGAAQDAASMGRVGRIGPSNDDIARDLARWVDTGQKPGAWRGIDDAVVDRVRQPISAALRDVTEFELLGRFTLDEWDDALAAADRLQDMPRWALPALNNPRTAEGVLDVYVDLLGDELFKSWARSDAARASLPPMLRDGLDERTWDVLQEAHRKREGLSETIEALSAERAVRNSMPYLDSHEIRSQAGEYARGFFPFMYAEENFLKRWARTIRVTPEALRKLQLAYMGLKHGGVIRTDSQGRDWYVYPGAGVIADVSNAALSTIGMGDVMPSGVVFASETRNMLPGFDIERTGLPSANPLVAMQIAGISSLFPELRPTQEALVGRVGVTQGGVAQFIPAAVRRFWDVAGDEESNVKYASAMMSAIAVLEHNGHGLPEHATRNQLDEYIRRLRNHTRGILAAQAWVGFLAPGAPSIQFTGEDRLDPGSLLGLHTEIPADVFRSEYIDMIQEFGIEDGTLKYFEANPDFDLDSLMAFTVGQSSSVSGAPLPATAEAVAFAERNDDWISQFPAASAWLLPQPPAGSEEFDEYAYVQQSISGMRQRRTPEEFLEALKYREGAFQYFLNRDRHEQLLDQAGDDSLRKREMEDAWATWKTRHLALHPIFADQLEGGESRQRRARVLEELRFALQDPSMPEVAHAEPLSQMVQMFDHYQITTQRLSTSRTQESIAAVERLKVVFADAAAMAVIQHPEIEPFWLSIIRPEANL